MDSAIAGGGSDDRSAAVLRRLDYLFDVSAIGASFVDLEGRYRRVNRYLCDVLGRTEEEMLGQTWRAFAYPEDVAPGDAGVARVLGADETMFRAERRYRKPDGSTVWCLLGVSLIREDGEPVGFFVQTHDITGLKISEQAMYREAQFVRLLRDVALASNETADPDHVMRVVLDLVCEQTGWPVGHVYALATDGSGDLMPTDIWHLDEPDRFSHFVAVTNVTRLPPGIGLPGRTLIDNKPAWVDDVTRDPNFPRAQFANDIGVRAGFAFPVLVGDSVAAVLEFFSTDAEPPDQQLLDLIGGVGAVLGRVIERTRAQQVFQAREEETRKIIDTASDAFVAIDAMGSIIDWNEQAERTFGWSREEAIGRPLTETIIPPSMRSAHEQGLARFFATGVGPVLGKRIEVPALHRDGTEFPVELAVWALGVGNTQRFNAFVHDISERKRTEQSLRDSEQKFAEAYERERQAAERLRVLDEMKNSFLTAVSHELRTPLTTVLGFAKLLEERGDVFTPEQRQDFTHRVAVSAEKLDRLLEDLLDLDRLSRGIVEPRRRLIDVRDLVRRVAEESSQWPEGTVHVEGEQVVAAIDPAKIERVVENLLANAAKHTPPDTKVWVRVEQRDKNCEIVVEDEGPGVPDELKRTIFTPFVRGATSPDHAPGTGIGLTLVARFTELHGGRVWVEDRVGGGAAFHVSLPGVLSPDPTVPHRDGEPFVVTKSIAG